MLRRVWSLLAPPLCSVCGSATEAEDALCRRCASSLARARPLSLVVPGADWALAATHYEGTARATVGALKFRARLPLAGSMATALAAAAATHLDGAVLVPVPPAPSRRRRRGFDPADEIARALAVRADLGLSRCLRRSDGPRQVGRPRRERLSSPPGVTIRGGSVPPSAVLVDDVVTTGATLAACAHALRAGGAGAVGALAFARAA